APAANCTIVIQFAPTSAVISADTIDIAYNNGAATVSSTRDVTGTGAAPALLNISDTDPYNFGLIASGGTTNHTFTVTNNGGVPATAVVEAGLAAPFQYLGGAYPGIGGDCGATIAVGATCSIVVEYAPAAP